MEAARVGGLNIEIIARALGHQRLDDVGINWIRSHYVIRITVLLDKFLDL